ncbi:hypothetical protein BKI52_41185 [marine bacterium AO1-C]|nr:hypothetical protein BKI52_41185 [marine bacterium AO1-C]
MSALAIINIIGLSQGLFLCFFLVSSRKRHTWSNLFLLLILMGFLCNLWDYLWINTRYALQYPHTALLGFPFRVTYGPLVWLITLSSLPSFRFKRRYLWHFAFFGLYILYGLYVYHSHSYQYKVSYLRALYTTLETPSALYLNAQIIGFNLILLGQFVFYLMLSYNILQKQKKYLAKPRKQWLTHILIAAILLWAIGFSKLLVVFSIHFLAPEFVYISCILLAIYLYALTFMSMQNPAIFSTPAIKYKDSPLKPSQTSTLVDQLTHYMQEHKPFTDANLTLKTLARKVDIPERQLSQAINTELQQNFYEFLNHYRIKAAQQMLVDPSCKGFTVLAIAYEVGFNSKSSFNTAFKKITGVTPSQFRKQSVIEDQ